MKEILGFVILHYKAGDITKKCIDKLLAQVTDVQYHIIVVDNFSNNGSFEELKRDYSNNGKVYFNGLNNNYGFAKANDVGYLIAKYKFNCTCIVVMNNDIIINDADFCKKIISINNKYSYDILGPDIVSSDGIHQNPNDLVIRTKLEVKKRLLILYLTKMLMPTYNLFRKKSKKKRINPYISTVAYQQPLHGACIIFSKNYIDRHDLPFYPDTFLYIEEEILYYNAIKEKLKILYNPTIVVHHLEDASTNKIVSTRKEKREFEINNSIRSLRIFLEIMGNNMNRRT